MNNIPIKKDPNMQTEMVIHITNPVQQRTKQRKAIDAAIEKRAAPTSIYHPTAKSIFQILRTFVFKF